MITRLAHMSLQTRDMQRAIAFYRDGLGFPISFTFTLKGKVAGAYFAVGGNSFLEVFEFENPCGITHYCLETDDIDDFIAKATAQGIACTPKTLGGCNTWQTWLRDPDGNAFEIHQYTERSMQFNGGQCEITWR
jgi:catechol 2,3-dioxygenase-like lactoylglutathione lyase family enzyme